MDKFAAHDRKPSHEACVRHHDRETADASKGLVRGLPRHIPVTTAKEIVCRLIVTVYTVVVLNLAFSSTPGLCEMQSLNGLEMGCGAYQNHEFWDIIIVLIASFYRAILIEKIKLSIALVGISIIMDGSGEHICAGFLNWKLI